MPKKLTKKQILEQANKRFQNRWMAAEDMSYIFPVDRISFTGKLPEGTSEPEILPLAIHATTFIDSVDDYAKVDRIVEPGQNVTFHSNPYYVERRPDGYREGIRFITKEQARKFIRNIREKLSAQMKLLDKLSP